MPTFLVLGHTQAADAIDTRDLAGASGRWDLLLRCVAAALLRSHGIREDSQIVLWLARGDRYVRLDGGRIRNLRPDESSVSGQIQKALQASSVGHHEEEVAPGLYVAKATLPEILDGFARAGPLLWLDEEGDEAGAWPASATYVLSDHLDPDERERKEIQARATAVRSLGKTVWQADQAIVLVHDRIARSQ